jgi:hypothetical protein
MRIWLRHLVKHRFVTCFPAVEAVPFLGSNCDSLARPFTPRPLEMLGNPSERECPAHDTAAAKYCSNDNNVHCLFHYETENCL